MNPQRKRLLELVEALSEEYWNYYVEAMNLIKSLEVKPYITTTVENKNEQRIIVTFHDWQTDDEIRSLVIQQNDDIHTVHSVLALIEDIPTFVHTQFDENMSKPGIHVLITPQGKVLSMYEVK